MKKLHSRHKNTVVIKKMLDELRYPQTGLEGQRLPRKSSNIFVGFGSSGFSVLGSVICGLDVVGQV